MEELPTIGASRSPFPNGRRLTALTSLGTVTVLAFAGWMHFSSPPDEAATPGPLAAGRADNHDRLRASPIPHEFDDNASGSVVTASATSLSDTPHDGGESDSTAAAASEPQTAADRHRQAILGKWADEYRGKRHLTVREDGTGTMVVEPDGIGKRLFAAELTIELEWTIDDEHVSLKMIRGEPKSKVQLILKLYGQEAEYKILELTAERMLLLDPDGKTSYDWHRPVADDEQAK
jgi:hypothetical protein